MILMCVFVLSSYCGKQLAKLQWKLNLHLGTYTPRGITVMMGVRLMMPTIRLYDQGSLSSRDMSYLFRTHKPLTIAMTNPRVNHHVKSSSQQLPCWEIFQKLPRYHLASCTRRLKIDYCIHDKLLH